MSYIDVREKKDDVKEIRFATKSETYDAHSIVIRDGGAVFIEGYQAVGLNKKEDVLNLIKALNKVLELELVK